MNPFFNAFKQTFQSTYSSETHTSMKVKTRKGSHNQRLNQTTVRVTLGNEITDYHLDHSENENLTEMDFSNWTPLHKYFGRFQGEIFTGIKYTYGYSLGKEKVEKYVESIIEYQQGRPIGEQIYFNTEGDVIRRLYLEERPIPTAQAQTA